MQGSVLTNNLYVTNGWFDDEPKAIGSSKYKRHVRPVSTIPSDHTIREGDVLYRRKRARIANPDQNPAVRTTTNGAEIPRNGERTETQFMNDYVVVGTSRKTTTYASGSTHGGDPVAVVHGITTVRNTGEESIRAGDCVEWYLTKNEAFSQYGDAWVAGFSRIRNVPGRRKLDLSVTNEDVLAIVGELSDVTDLPVDEIRAYLSRTDNEHAVKIVGYVKRFLNRLLIPFHEALETTVSVSLTSAASSDRFDEMVHPFMNVGLDTSVVPFVPESRPTRRTSSSGSEIDDPEEELNEPQRGRVNLKHATTNVHVDGGTNTFLKLLDAYNAVSGDKLLTKQWTEIINDYKNGIVKKYNDVMKIALNYAMSLDDDNERKDAAIDYVETYGDSLLDDTSKAIVDERTRTRLAEVHSFDAMNEPDIVTAVPTDKTIRNLIEIVSTDTGLIGGEEY